MTEGRTLKGESATGKVSNTILSRKGTEHLNCAA